jgi:hypothetical protein
LTSLKGCPKEVGDTFNCSENLLTSLEGCPIKVGGSFYCNVNLLTSLEGCPIKVDGYFDCSVNSLTSLRDCPKKVTYFFKCSKNKLTSLKGLPPILNEDLDISVNPISIIDVSTIVRNNISIFDTKFDPKIKELSKEKLRILFENALDYVVFRKDGSVNYSRLERLFKDFEV